MNDDGMLVSERWLTNADQTLTNLTAPTLGRRSRGLFYALCPFYQTTEWTKEDDVWTTTAQKLKSGSSVPDSHRTFKVCGCLGTAKPETKTGQRFWGILRGGRWEYVVGDDGKRWTTASLPYYYPTYGTALIDVAASVTVPRCVTKTARLVSYIEMRAGTAPTDTDDEKYLQIDAGKYLLVRYADYVVIDGNGETTVTPTVEKTMGTFVSSISTGNILYAATEEQ